TNADLMKVGGYKFSALEIEAILLEMKLIEKMCATVVPDVEIKKARDNGLKPDVTLDEPSKQKLAPYKVALYQVDLHINLSTIDSICTF
ncbi:hypothetical protein Tco_1477647, partial [Tanacetum coccineum]